MPVNSSESTKKNYRSDIDGLRALALVAIVGFDCGLPGTRGGFVGIDLFFVVSGYLVCQGLIEDHESSSFSVARFFLRRLRRIVPALSVVILFCLLLGALVMSPWEAYRLGQSAVAAAIFGSNFLYMIRGSYFAERAVMEPLLVTWPIAVAMQFYLVLGFLFAVLKRKPLRVLFITLAVLGGLSFVASVVAEFWQHVWNFYLPVTRAWELAVGSMLAIAHANRRNLARQELPGALGLLLVIGSIIAYRPEMRFPGFEALLPTFGALLLLASPNSSANRVLANRPLAFIGAASYSLYLWHWPLFSFAAICTSRPPGPLTTCLVLSISVAAALASFFFVERRFPNGPDRSPIPTVARYAVWSVLVACVGLLYFFSRGLPVRIPELYGIETRAALYRHYPCIAAGPYLRLSITCAPKQDGQKPAIAVLGGGHAEAFAEGLRDFLNASGWQLVTLTRESCPPTRGFSQWSPADSTLSESCRRYNRSALQYILDRADIRAVILVGRWRAGLVADGSRADPSLETEQENARSLRQGLANEIEALQRSGRHVLVIEDTPEFPFDPVGRIRSRYLPLRRAFARAVLPGKPQADDPASAPRAVAISPAEQLADQQVLDLGASDPDVTLIDPKQVFCNESRCSFASGDDVFFSDSIHLSRTGAMQILPLLPSISSLK